MWFDVLFCAGVTILVRSLFLLYRTIRSYIPSRVDFPSEFGTKWALVTGCNSGLGRHLALLIAMQQVNIIGVGLADDGLKSTQAECERLGVEFVPVGADLTDMSSVRAIMSACDGRDVAAALLNAGLGYMATIANMCESDIIGYVNLMCSTNAVLAREFASRHLRRTSKSVIYFTASVAADIVFPSSVLYCATKSFISRFGKLLSLELAGSHTKITVMHPGFFGHSKFFRDSLQQAMDKAMVFPGSEKIADMVMATIGRATMVDCTLNSIALRVGEWILGEAPLRCLCARLVKK
jgi:short-subunit dehydrogenase